MTTPPAECTDRADISQRPRALLLGAGFGSRLRPLTAHLPKPLVPLGDRPLAAHAMARLQAAGFDRVLVNTHHLASAWADALGALGVPVELVHEPEIRGTAGGIAGARDRFGPGPIVAWNGDILVDPPLAELTAAAAKGGLGLAVSLRPAGRGTVGLGADGRVVRLRGQRFGEEVQGGDYVGVCAAGERVLGELPASGCLVGDWALPALGRGEVIATAPVTGPWSDVGTPTAYLAANLAWARARGGVFLGEGAAVTDGVELEDAVVGASARVTGRGALRRVVVWPRARVTAPLSDAVVLTDGTVVPVAP